MTESEALYNQLHDEIHVNNLKIIDVSTNLAALSDRVDAVSESNAEANNNINRMANAIDNNTSGVTRANNRLDQMENDVDGMAADIKDIHGAIDEHDSRLDVLEESIKHTAHTVAVRAAKSVSRSIQASEIEELHQEIHEVALAVDEANSNYDPRVTDLENYVADIYRNVNHLYVEDASIWDAMQDMDVEHHEELHRLALCIDNHESRIGRLENIQINYVEWLERIDSSLGELDGEIDRIDNYFDVVDSSIVNINNHIDASINELPKHVVLTKEAYDDLDHPELNTFYYTYED